MSIEPVYRKCQQNFAIIYFDNRVALELCLLSQVSEQDIIMLSMSVTITVNFNSTIPLPTIYFIFDISTPANYYNF